MNDAATFALLRDLAALLAKHGPATFQELARYLRDPQLTAELATILDAHRSLEELGSKKKARASFATSVQQGWLEKLRIEDPAKAELLLVFQEALGAKRCLQTLRQLRDFADDARLKRVTAESREKAILPMLRDLASRSIEDVRDALQRVRMDEGVGDRTLEGWANVILNKRP